MGADGADDIGDDESGSLDSLLPYEQEPCLDAKPIPRGLEMISSPCFNDSGNVCGTVAQSEEISVALQQRGNELEILLKVEEDNSEEEAAWVRFRSFVSHVPHGGSEVLHTPVKST